MRWIPVLLSDKNCLRTNKCLCTLIKMSPKKKMLTLKEKMEVVNVADREKLSTRALAIKFNIGKTQAANIMKNKEHIRSKWQIGINVNQKKSFLKTEGLNIDKKCLEWFESARNQNIPISGPLVKAKAKQIAEQLGYNSFRASDGWLEKWRKRNSINFKCKSSEAADVNKKDMEQFMDKLPSILLGYQPEDVYNSDESGHFAQAVPDISLTIKSEKCTNFVTESDSENDNKNESEDEMQETIQDSDSVNSYDKALKLVASLKQFARNDFIAFQHIKNLESHFEKCLLQQKKDKNTPNV